jgi:hypothetical protein
MTKLKDKLSANMRTVKAALNKSRRSARRKAKAGFTREARSQGLQPRKQTPAPNQQTGHPTRPRDSAKTVPAAMTYSRAAARCFPSRVAGLTSKFKQVI